MDTRKSSAKIGFLLALTLGPATLMAQNEADGESGFLLHERIRGSGSTLGLISKFDTALGYQFNRYLAVEGGVPLYVVRPSSTTSQVTGVQAATGIGNAYADLRLTLLNQLVNYTSLLTAAARPETRQRVSVRAMRPTTGATSSTAASDRSLPSRT